jgi:hypothetical protein
LIYVLILIHHGIVKELDELDRLALNARAQVGIVVTNVRGKVKVVLHGHRIFAWNITVAGRNRT